MIPIPKLAGVAEVNENAWQACVEYAEARQKWGQKIRKDKAWLRRACDESLKMAEDACNIPLEEQAKRLYVYFLARHNIGVQSDCPASFQTDIDLWNAISTTGKHPHTQIFS